MTAQTFNATVRPSTVWSTEKKKGGNYPLTSAAVTSLTAVTTATTVNEVLDIVSTVVRDSHVVAANKIGLATSVES
jgi:hypothetical protein